jgi:hypothetical protein
MTEELRTNDRISVLEHWSKICAERCDPKEYHKWREDTTARLAVIETKAMMRSAQVALTVSLVVNLLTLIVLFMTRR